MPAQLSGLLGRAQKTVGQFSLAQRVLAVLGVALLVLGGVALSAWMSKPTMTPLFANLSAADASAIVDKISASGVQYELSDGGSTILVPASKVYDVRLQVAAAGLPTSSSEGAGYSLLDKMGMTSSDFQQQVTYQRAIEGELAKTIASLDSVTNASVHLALPADSVFVDTKADPTASVFIETKPGSTLSADQVQSIVHLVSAGIENMKPTDVAVVDAQGHVLSTVGGSSQSSILQGSQTADYEARVTSNVQAMLDQVLGAGNAVVRVTADLDFDQTATTTETYSATQNLPPSSSSTTIEKYTGDGQTVGGVLGVDGSTIDPTTTGGTGSGNYEKSASTVNNPINKVTEQMTTAPGTVRRQSVSVIVADSLKGVDLTSLQTSIAAAAGVDTTRGDVVSVTQMPFDTTAAETAKAAIAQADKEAKAAKTTELIKTGGIGVAILIAVILLIIIGLRRGKQARREAIDLGDLELLEAARAQAIEAAAVPRALPAVPAIAESRRDDVLALAAEQPAEVAEVLRGWLTAGRA